MSKDTSVLEQIEKIRKLKSELDLELVYCHTRVTEIGEQLGVLYATVRSGSITGREQFEQQIRDAKTVGEKDACLRKVGIF